MQRILLSLMAIIAISLAASAQKTWDGGAGNQNWSSAENWNPNGVPDITDNVSIGSGFHVTVDVPAFCQILTISGGNSSNSLTIAGTNSLTVTSALVINAGSGAGDNKLISVGAGSITTYKLMMQATGDDSRRSEITVVDGSVTINGDFTMNDADVDRNRIILGSNATLNIAGNIEGGDIDAAAGSTVNYRGTATQVIKGDTYGNIIFSGGGDKIIYGRLNVINSATFIDGIVYSTETDILNFNDGATVSVNSLSSFVDGPVRKAGNESFEFPVGRKDGGFHPISISAPASVSSAFTAEYIRESARLLGHIDPVGGLVAISNCEYWNLTRTGSVSNVNVSVSWNENSECGSTYVTTLNGLTAAQLGANGWTLNGTAVAATGTTASGFATANNVSAFTSFTLATLIDGSPLPVKFGTIKAARQNGGVMVDWTTFNEVNVSHYEVERSVDGRIFTKLGERTAANRIDKNMYDLFDATAPSTTCYYRVKGIDVDGKVTVSPVVRLSGGIGSDVLTVFPNPVKNGAISLQSSSLPQGSYSLKIFNASGQLLHVEKLYHSGGSFAQAIQLPSSIKPGINNIELTSPEVRIVKSILVQ